MLTIEYLGGHLSFGVLPVAGDTWGRSLEIVSMAPKHAGLLTSGQKNPLAVCLSSMFLPPITSLLVSWCKCIIYSSSSSAVEQAGQFPFWVEA